MAVEGLSRPIRLAVRIDVPHDPSDLAPVGPHAQVSNGMLFIEGREHGIAGRRSAASGLRGGRDMRQSVCDRPVADEANLTNFLNAKRKRR